MGRPKKVAGAKSDAISIRVEPRVRFGVELLSRLHHESVAEVVTRAILDAFTDLYGQGLFVYADKDADTPTDLLALVWDERPSDRLANLAFRYPAALSGAERELWGRVLANRKYWQSAAKAKAPVHSEKTLLRDSLAEDWPALTEAANG